MGVGEPAADGDSVLRVEDVGCRRVVDDDCLSKVAAYLGKVLVRLLVPLRLCLHDQITCEP